ncbi:hypothetical protein HispidOSU_002664, partial [Sigmodon hispidus]
QLKPSVNEFDAQTELPSHDAVKQWALEGALSTDTSNEAAKLVLLNQYYQDSKRLRMKRYIVISL